MKNLTKTSITAKNSNRNFSKNEKGQTGFRYRFTQFVCAVLIGSILTVSVPAAPLAIKVSSNEIYKDIRFAFLSENFGAKLSGWMSSLLLFLPAKKQTQSIGRIEILPGEDTIVRQGEPVNFTAIAYSTEGNPVGGLKFKWTVKDVGRNRPTRNLANGTFPALATGTFVITAEAGGLRKQINVSVQENQPLLMMKKIKADEASGNLEDVEKLKREKKYSTEVISSKKDYKDKKKDDKTTEQSEISYYQPAEPPQKKLRGPNAGEGSNAAEYENSLAPAYNNATAYKAAGRMMRPIDEQGWDNDNWWTADDPGNGIGTPPGTSPDAGAGNGNFQFSAPIIALPGRGIDLNLSLSYNSRLWSKSGNRMSYDSDRGFPAPGWSLGFGKMMFMGTGGGCMVIEADGTRRGYNGTLSNYSSGNYVSSSFSGHTADGSFIDYNCSYSSSQYGKGFTASAKLPNGTTISYNSSTSNGEQAFPTQISDAQGNYINITYRGNRGPEIQTITDTMGRVITFNYDSDNRLISVSVPKMDNAGTRTAVQLNYKQVALNASFAYPLTMDAAGWNPKLIDAIHYPGTGTGYWFGDGDSYSSYGMIAKVLELRAMNWSTVTNQPGTIPGQMSKQAVYNYPLGTVNDTGRTNGVSLSDAPTYETLTESWAGMDDAPAVTSYEIHSDATPRTITVTQPNGVKSKQTSFHIASNDTANLWKDGLIYQDETLDGNNQQLSKSVVEWEPGSYDSARPKHTEITDERGQTLKTDLTYGTNYNQLVSQKEYDYNGTTLLKETRNSYENSASYTGRHIFNLVKTNEIFDGSGNRVARTDTEYDNNAVVNGTQNHNLKETPGVTMHLSTSDPYTTETVSGCAAWSYEHSECNSGMDYVYVGDYPQYVVYCPAEATCTAPFEYSVYDGSSLFRGNPTKTTVYADAANLTGAIAQTKQYDVTGNLVTESASCCQLKTYVYDNPLTTEIDTQYAYPVIQTRGSSDPNSPLKITTSAVYDFNTGLIKQTTDANGRTDSTVYNVDTLRPTVSTSSTGAYSTSVYDDAAMSIVNETHEYGGSLASKNTKYLNGIGKVEREEALGANNVVDTVETQYTKLGQIWKRSRPYRSGDTVLWTEVTYDLMGRTSQVTEPDGSTSKVFYNEASRPNSASTFQGNTTRSRDAWGRERWTRNDAFGRLVEVVEPNPNGDGSFSPTGNLVTNYVYNTLGQVTQTNQDGQLRAFKYDSLSRMTRQKLAEQSATINDAGQYIGENVPGANWSGAVTYDDRSNIIQKVDPRGVKTNYSFQTGGSDDPLNRIHGISYDLSGPHDTSKPIPTAAFVSYEYMTTGDQSRIKKIRTAGILTEDFTYDDDEKGRVKEYTQKVDYREDYPWVTTYGYDTLGRVTGVQYPAQYGPSGGTRKLIENKYDIASRLTGLQVDGQDAASNITYNASDQTTSIKIGTSGTNQITENYTFDPQTGLLTNQNVVKNGSNLLLDLSYDYTRNNSAGNTNVNWKTGALTKILDNNDHNKDREFRFDALGRLTAAKGKATDQWEQQYVYDRYGNRTSVTATGYTANNAAAVPRDGFANLSYNAASNRITTTGFEYDAAGNQTRALAEDGSGLKFEYDAANRLQYIRKDDANQTMVQAFQFGSTNARLIDYDAAINRNTFYANAGGKTLVEYTEYAQNVPTWTKSCVFLGDRQLSTITPTDGSSVEYTEYHHLDRLGTRLITNQAGGTSYEQTHLPFGTAFGAESAVIGNAGKRFTSYDRSGLTGLDYAQNRTYDSKQGRFTQVDPIGMKASSLSNPQSLNLYNYVGNDPINRTDPDGLFWGAIKNFFKKVFKVIAFVALVVAVVYLAVTGIGLITSPIISKALTGLAFLFGASFLAAKVGATVYSRVKEFLNRCDVPGFAGLSRARQDELAQRGVSPEQWNNLKNKQRLGYFNITAAIASAGLSLMGWLVDWAAGGIQQDRTFFIQGQGATNLLAQVASSSLFSIGGGILGSSYRQNTLTRSAELTFSSDGRRLEVDIDSFNPNRGAGGFALHSYEVVSHKLGYIFGGTRTNPYNVAYRSSWECK